MRSPRPGKAELNLPMYVNAALSDPVHGRRRRTWRERRAQLERDRHLEGGGAAHRSIAPDIYNRDHANYAQYLEHYARPDNALFVPETGNAPSSRASSGRRSAMARSAGRRSAWMRPAISIFRSARSQLDPETLDAFAAKFRLLAPVARDWARLAVRASDVGASPSRRTAPTRRPSSAAGRSRRNTACGQFGERDWTRIEPPNPEQGQARRRRRDHPARARRIPRRRIGRPVRFALTRRRTGENSQFLDVEEGTFENGRGLMARRWNGDQIDYGLNLSTADAAQGSAGDLSMKRAVFAFVWRRPVRRPSRRRSSGRHRNHRPSERRARVVQLQVYPDGIIRVTEAPTADPDLRPSLMVRAKPLFERLHAR